MTELKEILSANGAVYCLECGKCSAVCPVTRWETGSFANPRRLIETAFRGGVEDLFRLPLFWSCLTCKRCSELCPSDVHFSEFIRDARILALEKGARAPCTHGDVVSTWGRIMTDPLLRQDRLGWLGDDLEISSDSETIFFAGCLPHYATLFEDLDIEGLEIARAGIRILNAMDIRPRVLADERCCGHDHLWEGDFKTFQKLGRLNIDLFKSAGAKRIVTACPECARTLKLDYPRFIDGLGIEIVHIAQFAAERLARGAFRLDRKENGRLAAFQDPCRLGRHLGVYEQPRMLLEALGYRLVEMPYSRSAARCCGTSCWTACGQMNKSLQMERLKEAGATGADLLVTACPKCQIHFKCAQKDPLRKESIDVKIRDISTLVAGAVGK
jgi:Fe-S oxidoreductase